MNNTNMNNMELMQAMQLIANAGLTIVNSDGEVKAKPKKKIRSRRPKGWGTVYKLSDSRKKPWVACATIGYDKNDGHQIKKIIGTYENKEQAEEALSIYNMQRMGLIKDNASISTSSGQNSLKTNIPTFEDIWEIVLDEEIENKSYSTKINYITAYHNLEDIIHYPINEINLHILQPVFEKTMKKGAGKSKMNMMKVVCRMVFRYAIKYDYIEKNYAEYIQYEATNETKINRQIFTKNEIINLIKDESIESKIVLISLFTGLRPQELVNIEKQNIHLEEDYMIGGMKTKSGKDRIIPIHKTIKPYINEIMKNDNKYLVFDIKGRYGYEEYRSTMFVPLMKKLKLNHSPYDTRHTFATMAKMSKIEEYARKKIMGHASNDLTDDIYTHASIKYLVEEVNKIKIEDLK